MKDVTVVFQSGGDPRPFKCEDCNYSAVKASHLKQHVTVVHLKLKLLHCVECIYRASSQSDLEEHVRRFHPGLTLYKCGECDYKTARNDMLLRHSNYAHRRSPLFECEECDYKTTAMKVLESHISSAHRGAKPFECAKCSYKASSKSMLDTHLKSKHRKVKQYTCDLCFYSTWSQNALEVHDNSAHGLKCTMCKYRATDNSVLVEHQWIAHKVERLSTNINSETRETSLGHIETAPAKKGRFDFSKYVIRPVKLVGYETLVVVNQPQGDQETVWVTRDDQSASRELENPTTTQGVMHYGQTLPRELQNATGHTTEACSDLSSRSVLIDLGLLEVRDQGDLAPTTNSKSSTQHHSKDNVCSSCLFKADTPVSLEQHIQRVHYMDCV